MPSHHLYTIVLTLLHLPLNNAQHLLRAQPHTPKPHTTPAPLLIRQDITIETCDAGATSCQNGIVGCCSIGAACSVTTSNIPICLQACGFSDVTCTGILNGLCCDFDQFCDYQSTRCVDNSYRLAPPSLSPDEFAPQTSLPQQSATAVVPSSPTVQVPAATAASSTPTAIPATASPSSSPSSSLSSIEANTPTFNPVTYLPTTPLVYLPSTNPASAPTQIPVFPTASTPTVTVTTTPSSGTSKLTRTLTLSFTIWLAGCGLIYVFGMWT